MSDTCKTSIFQDIFNRVAPPLRRFLYYKTGVWDATEDLVQESFLRLWKNCKEVAPEKAGSFLYTVANRLFVDDYRKKQVAFKFQTIQSGLTEAHSETPEFEIEMQEFQKKLDTALAQLTEGQRLVFLLNRIDKFTYVEIAAQLDISVKTVEKRMHGALLELRKIYSRI